MLTAPAAHRFRLVHRLQAVTSRFVPARPPGTSPRPNAQPASVIASQEAVLEEEPTWEDAEWQ